MKKVAIIPILLGSTRIPDKNLLMVDGYPMAFYVAKACKLSGVFDEIYLNSEHNIVEKMANMLEVKFYQRSPRQGGSACTMRNKSRVCEVDRCQTHDHFLYDFMSNIESDYLGLVHTTSPLLKPDTIQKFMDVLENEKYDSLFSVEERFTETLFRSQPLNFSFSKKMPTQTLKPLQMLTWALSGWKTSSFMNSYKNDNSEESGPTFCGKTGVFPLDRIQALDADTWDDLELIEAILFYRRKKNVPGIHRFKDNVVKIDHNLKALIEQDGVSKFNDENVNAMLSNLDEIARKMGPAPWLHLLVSSGDDQVGLICQESGEGARKHCHITHDEWWLVLKGEFEWRLGSGKVIKAGPQDVVFLPRGTIHSIVCTSHESGIRLACGARDMEHIYVT